MKAICLYARYMPGSTARQLDSSTARQLDSSTARQNSTRRSRTCRRPGTDRPMESASSPRQASTGSTGTRQARPRQPLDSSLDSASTEPRQLDSSTVPVGSTLNVSGRRASLDHQHHRVRMSYTLHGRRWARPSCTLGANARSPSPRHRAGAQRPLSEVDKGGVESLRRPITPRAARLP